MEQNEWNKPRIWGDKNRLHIATTATVNDALFNLSSGDITIEDYVFFGYGVSLITGTHDYHKTGLARQQSFPQDGKNILIKRGAWICSGAMILGPCVIGENSVVGACTLIDKDVPPNMLCYAKRELVLKPIEIFK